VYNKLHNYYTKLHIIYTNSKYTDTIIQYKKIRKILYKLLFCGNLQNMM